MSIEAMKRLVAAVDAIPEGVEGWMPGALTDALIDAKKAIAQAEKQEPVKQCMEHGECFGGKCIYIHPQPKQLTIAQLREHWQVAKVLDMTDAEIDFADYVLIARDVEALYGITSDMKQEYVAKTAKQRHEENT